jgi:hypothetical protein
MPSMPPIYGKFRLISRLGDVRELECQRCGCEFETSHHPDVLIWCLDTHKYFTRCPLCHTREEAQPGSSV